MSKTDKTKLLTEMLVKGLSGFAMMGLLLFGCAGSIRFTNAWLMILLFAALMLAMGVYLLAKKPELLEKRMNTRETQNAQKRYVVLIALIFIASFALAGFDYRYQWSKAPFAMSIVAALFMIFGYVLYVVVIIQNAYASRVVEVQKEQTVIETGLYSVVRHPMYLAMLILFLAVPFVLGSYISVVPMAILPIGLVLRIKNEELVLVEGLDGYVAYTQKTKYRLIPFIW
jgi:protein-S-isoprenylcysteine O-methyltransferase Ste14